MNLKKIMLTLIPTIIGFGQPATLHAEMILSDLQITSTNFHVDESNGCNGVPLSSFTLATDGDDPDFRITSVRIVINPHSTVWPTSLFLSKDNQMVLSVPVNEDPYEMNIPADHQVKAGATNMFSVSATFPPSTKNLASFEAKVSTITVESVRGGKKVTEEKFLKKKSEPPFHRFHTKGAAQWEMVGSDLKDVKSPDGEIQSRVASFTLIMTAVGSDIEAPSNSDFQVISRNGNFEKPCVVTVETIPHISPVMKGSKVTVKVSAFLPKSTVIQYLRTEFYIGKIKWKGEGQVVEQDWGLESFKTPAR